MFRHNETQTCVKGRKRNSLQKPKQNSLCGEAGQATKECVGW